MTHTSTTVRDEFTRWDGHPRPKRTFQSEWVDVDALCAEVAQLRNLLQHGDVHHDVATLRNVQEQKNKVVAAAERVTDDPSMLVTLFGAVKELRRITGAAS
jgi:hypothetical protein